MKIMVSGLDDSRRFQNEDVDCMTKIWWEEEEVFTTQLTKT